MGLCLKPGTLFVGWVKRNTGDRLGHFEDSISDFGSGSNSQYVNAMTNQATHSGRPRLANPLFFSPDPQ